MVMELLAKAGRNIDIYENSFDGNIHVTEADLDRWIETFPGADMEEIIDSIIEELEESALSVSGDFYRYYEFDNFTVVWGPAYDD
jgi:hypothetical protein